MLLPLDIILLFISGVHLMPVELTEESEVELPKKEATTRECYYKIVGTQGSIYSPQISQQNITCEWDIDVTKGFVAVLEFEYLGLPVEQERACESYVEISYGTLNDPIKRTFCPADRVDTFYTDSQVATVRYHFGTYRKDYDGNQFGFKINYSAVAINTSAIGNNAVIMLILLLSFATMFAIALCAFCFRCRPNVRNNMSVPNEMGVAEPNAPTRQQLQEAFEFQRCVMQGCPKEPKKMSFSIFQSESTSGSSNLNRWASKQHLPTDTYVVQKAEKQHLSLGSSSTPLSFFPELRRKWSEDSVRRIQRLRTKLVARFSAASSHNTSDTSVFFPASDRGVYSQLSYEEEKTELQDPVGDGKCEMKVGPSSMQIPSIVIEFVE